MKVKNAHYSNYLISVQFDRKMSIDTLKDKQDVCKNFMSEIGKLARKSGIRLHATYSIVSGANGFHAHFAINWLPLTSKRVRFDMWSNQPIARHPIITILEDVGFFVDNPKQAIKRITRDKPFVTSYVIGQPKEAQNTQFSGFYKHTILEPNHSYEKTQSYCSSALFQHSKNYTPKSIINHLKSFGLISAAYFILISAILLSLF